MKGAPRKRGRRANIGDGIYEMGNDLKPIDFGAGRTVVQISAGYRHTCALLDNGVVMCFGQNSNGQLGTDNYTEASPIPRPLWRIQMCYS